MLPVSSIISLIGLISGLSPTIFSIILHVIGFSNFYISIITPLIFIAICFHFITIVAQTNVKSNKLNFLCALSLGLVSSFSIYLAHRFPNHLIFSLYLLQLCFFHWSEFFVTSLKNPAGAMIDFYMLNHSIEYHVALTLSVLEYWVEHALFQEYFTLTPLKVLSIMGVMTSTFGELLRKIALWTAGSNFNHYVERRHRDDHVLVRHGVYSFCRHPSYVGWYLFSLGTQLALLNPVCLVGYAIAAWHFFSERVIDEERALLRFFGEQYRTYQREVSTGLPFIRGYIVDDA